MRRITTLFVLCISTFLSFGQNALNEIATVTQNGNWVKIKANQSLNASEYLTTFKEDLSLGNDYDFRFLREDVDQLGMSHTRYDVTYKGVKIQGSQYILHSQGGLLKSANGKLVRNVNTSVIPDLSFEDALERAKSLLKTKYFYWDSPEKEALIKDIRNDDNATFFPKEELILLDPTMKNEGDNYTLAYRLDLYFEGEHDHAILFIDAHSGQLLYQLDGCHNTSVNGTANTKYHGVRDIVTDSINPSKYVLIDATRGDGIETYNAQTNNQVPNPPVNFEDTDNYWNNFNANMDEVATDIHWGGEMFYDYFFYVHNRLSYNNQNGKIVGYAHYRSNFFNASWNGVYAVYGDGNGNPLTSIDVVAHEMAHGVTEYTSNLVYAYESGALNESFSDIFGTAVEFYAMGSNGANWEVGLLDFKLRSMSDPKSFGDPDTYKGANWVSNASDNGGVHTNSSVQNYWFYLLSEGGSGVNDNGDAYQVDSIGMMKAEQISYRNLAYYLTENSQYIDARRGSIWAAEDLYGSCSNEVQQVADAWYAVGLGPDEASVDIEIVDLFHPSGGCFLTANESLSVDYAFFNSGCGDSALFAGDTIIFGYQLNGNPPVTEAHVLTSAIQNFDTVSYKFNTPMDLSQSGDHNLNVWIMYSKDFYRSNDSITEVLISSRDFISADETLGFEFQDASHEQVIYFPILNANSFANISAKAKNTGFLGYLMTVKEFETDQDDFPDFEYENFIKNPENSTEICMCVDATSWNNVTLEFDLKMTYSGVYAWYGLNSSELVSSMRVKANGNQIGGQYHPNTNMDDPYVRHYVDLDQYAGQQIEVCLESKHHIPQSVDAQIQWINTQGDNTYLDNIKIANYDFVSIDENPVASIKAYPNPTSGNFALRIESLAKGDLDITVIDALGQVVLEHKSDVFVGNNNINLDLSSYPKGVYMVQVRQNGFLTSEKLILH